MSDGSSDDEPENQKKPVANRKKAPAVVAPLLVDPDPASVPAAAGLGSVINSTLDTVVDEDETPSPASASGNHVNVRTDDNADSIPGYERIEGSEPNSEEEEEVAEGDDEAEGRPAPLTKKDKGRRG